MDNGWIKIHRKILDNPVTSRADWAWLWVCLLICANHSERKIIWNGESKTIKRGQFITSRNKLALMSNISVSSVQRALKYFESEQQIEQQTNNRFRLITVKNYDQYQQSEQQSEHPVNIQRTASEQPVNTNNNDKNDKNKKNDKKVEGDKSPAQIAQDFFDNHNYEHFAIKFYGSYPKELVDNEFRKFWAYWTEPMKNGKPRWMGEKAFEITRRLITWFGRIQDRPNYKQKPIVKINR